MLYWIICNVQLNITDIVIVGFTVSRVSLLYYLLQISTCQDNNTGIECAIIDRFGNVLYTPVSNSTNRWIGDVDGTLASSLKSYWYYSVNVDYSTDTSVDIYELNVSFINLTLPSYDGNCWRGNVQIARIAKSNLFLIVYDRGHSNLSCCMCCGETPCDCADECLATGHWRPRSEMLQFGCIDTDIGRHRPQCLPFSLSDADLEALRPERCTPERSVWFVVVIVVLTSVIGIVTYYAVKRRLEIIAREAKIKIVLEEANKRDTSLAQYEPVVCICTIYTSFTVHTYSIDGCW